MDKLIKKTPEFKALRVQAREIIAAFADGADFDFTINVKPSEETESF